MKICLTAFLSFNPKPEAIAGSVIDPVLAVAG
jgi:hypothetical protein